MSTHDPVDGSPRANIGGPKVPLSRDNPARSWNLAAILGALVAIIAITAAVILRANNNGSSVAFLGVISPTILALLTLMKTEAVQNQVHAVQNQVHVVQGTVNELTNGKMHESVHAAVSEAIAPIAETLEHATSEIDSVPKRGEEAWDGVTERRSSCMESPPNTDEGESNA